MFSLPAGVQDCSYALLNGTHIAPLEKMHTWIRVEGPDTIAPIPGAPQTIPTLGINHIVYGHHKNKNLILQASGTIYPISQGGKTRIVTAPGSALSLFGTELQAISYDFTMSFKAIFTTME